MNRFFSNNRLMEQFVIDNKEEAKHIKNVLRLRVGDKIEISDYQYEYVCQIHELSENVTCNILEKMDIERESSIEIFLFQGLPKSDKMEWIIQKSTELGINHIIPIKTERAVMKIKKMDKLDRWHKIAFAAAKQSKRNMIPKIHPPVDVKHLIEKYIDQLDVLFIPYEKSNDIGLKNLLNTYKGYKKIGIFVGPEGGFDQKDLEAVVSDKTQIISLGNRILRTETAAITVVGIIQFYLGDIGE